MSAACHLPSSSPGPASLPATWHGVLYGVHVRECCIPPHVAAAQQVPGIAVERGVGGAVAHEGEHGLRCVWGVGWGGGALFLAILPTK